MRSGGAPRGVIVCACGEPPLHQLAAQLTRGTPAYAVEACASGEAALRTIEEVFAAGGEVHLVLAEDGLPGMGGDRLLEAVHQRHPGVMKVLLGGTSGLEAAVRAINHASVDRYLQKPWPADEVQRAVDDLLAQHRERRERDEEHLRLARRSRELHSLHALGRGLGSASGPDRVLALTSEGARGIAGTLRAEVVAQVDTHERPWWSSPAAPPFTVEVRRSLEAALTRHRALRSSGLPIGIPERVLPVAIEHGGALFGWVFLVDPPALSRDTRDLLEVLAGQAATTLHNLELMGERLRSERLTTIGRMMSAIVHDFRNPMTSIRGYAAMIEEMDIGPERRKKAAHLVVEETDRMSAMIDEILEFTRGGPPRLIRRDIPLGELLAKLHRLIEHDLADRKVELLAELAFEGVVQVDVDRLMRALLNITANALDAMPEGGRLTVRSELRDGRVAIAVHDTGHGIPEELLPRIFEAFFTHGKPRGVGLGMSISRKIVDEHGGEILLKSRVGEGTCVTVLLPAAPS